jgi:hypothetical protein
MRNWMKQLGTSLGLVFTLGVSSTALAYPPQCPDVCGCADSCGKICYMSTHPTTCAEWEVCVDYCRSSAPQASLTPEAKKQQDASQNVCTEQAQEPVSSESPAHRRS